MTTSASGMAYVMIARIPVSGVVAFEACQSQVLPLLAEHDGQLQRRLRSDDGQIEVSISQTAQSLCMEVRDDGAGIPAEDLKRLGQPFEQVTQDSRLARGGTGLGLALVQGLMRLHGGRVWLESPPGTGVRAYLHFPSTLAAPAARARA